MSQTFVEKLTQATGRNDSLLCLGLDPNPAKFPTHFPKIADDAQAALLNWGQSLIEQTSDLVCCYKPNFAYYEQFGPAGLKALRLTIEAVPENIPVLLDAKRGDIGSTATAYAHAAFEVWGADAVTVNPYLGQDSIMPFLKYPGKTVFILCYTSNPSAREIQEFGTPGQGFLFEHVARQAQTWGSAEQVAFVVGATHPRALARFRALAPNHWVLAPGVGAQGGRVNEAIMAGLKADGSGMIIPASRSISYAASPRNAAATLRDEINRTRAEITSTKKATGEIQNDQMETMAPFTKTELVLGLYELGCLQFGQFTLASGQPSPFYIDLRRLSGNPKLLQMAAHAYADLLNSLSFDRLAAVPYAALTIGTAVALTANRPLIYPRKEVKSYGTGRAIEGIFSKGERAVIIEDLVTTGSSVLNAIESLAKAGLIVEDVVVLIDREQGGARNLADKGYRLHAALPFSEILETLVQAGRISIEDNERVQSYLANQSG